MTTRDKIADLLVPHIGRAMSLERANNIMQVMVLEPDADIGPLAREMLRHYSVPETVLQSIERIQS